MGKYEFKINVKQIAVDLPYTLSETWRAVEELAYWCNELDPTGVLAPYPSGQGSHGNLSARIPKGFIITGWQRPSKVNLKPEEFAFVNRYDPATNTIYYAGGIEPSSESILHFRIYQQTEAGAIAHGHEDRELVYSSRSLWEQLGIRETLRDAREGTIETADAALEVLDKPDTFVVLKEHWQTDTDIGIVTIGETLQEAAERMIKVHRALKEGKLASV